MLVGVRHASRFVVDLTLYAVINRVWWIVPLFLILLTVAALIVVGQAAAPVTLYPMF